MPVLYRVSSTPAHSFQIALDHLPTIQTRSGGHEKRFAAGFSPIRITPHLIEPLSSTFRSQLTNETGALMKVLSFISQTLLVRPISGNVTIPPTCDEYAFGPNEGKCRILHNTTQCGPYIVPNQYLGTRQVCTSLYGSCHEQGANGTGAANTDFLLFVGTQSKSRVSFYTVEAAVCKILGCKCNCVYTCLTKLCIKTTRYDHSFSIAYCSSSSTLAFASSCAIDQWRRPSTGYLTLCTSVSGTGTFCNRIILYFSGILPVWKTGTRSWTVGKPRN